MNGNLDARQNEIFDSRLSTRLIRRFLRSLPCYMVGCETSGVKGVADHPVRAVPTGDQQMLG